MGSDEAHGVLRARVSPIQLSSAARSRRANSAKATRAYAARGTLFEYVEVYLYLSDRRVDMFTAGERNVYPAEIEGALCEHPDVLSCLVVGVPDEDLGGCPTPSCRS